MRTKYSL